MLDGTVVEEQRLEVPLYSRVTLLEIDTLRVDLDDAVEQFEAQVLPVRELPGFEGVVVMVTPRARE